MPTVSFILPAYKRRFLAEAIAGILAQTCGDFELVVVDDGSPEGLAEVVGAFDDVRLRYLRYDTNLGRCDLVAAWNRAFAEAKGEFTVLASDDDRYHPAYLEEMLSLAARYPTVDLFHCRLSFIDAEGRVCGTSEVRAEHESAVWFLYNRGVRHLGQCAPDFIFRTAALRACGGFVPMPRAWYADDATWMMLARRGGVAYSPRILFDWRASGVNISTDFSDAAEKLVAGERFREWVRCYLKTLTPETEEELAMLAGMPHDLDVMIDAMSFWVFRHLSPVRAWRAICSVDDRWAGRMRFVGRMVHAAFRRMVASFGGKARAGGGNMVQ